MSNFKSDEFRQPRRVQVNSRGNHRSRLAVTAFILSMVFFLPLVSLLAAVLAVVSLLRMRRNALLSGAALAWTAMAIGLVVTGGWSLFGYRTWQIHTGVEAGPTPALMAGFKGDVHGFKAAFGERGLMLSDEHAILYLAAVEERFGTFMGAEFESQVGDGPIRRAGVATRYQLRFDGAMVPAEATYMLPKELPWSGSGTLGYLKIDDPAGGTLIFPGPKPEPRIAGAPGS